MCRARTARTLSGDAVVCDRDQQAQKGLLFALAPVEIQKFGPSRPDHRGKAADDLRASVGIVPREVEDAFSPGGLSGSWIWEYWPPARYLASQVSPTAEQLRAASESGELAGRGRPARRCASRYAASKSRSLRHWVISAAFSSAIAVSWALISCSNLSAYSRRDFHPRTRTAKIKPKMTRMNERREPGPHRPGRRGKAARFFQG